MEEANVCRQTISRQPDQALPPQVLHQVSGGEEVAAELVQRRGDGEGEGVHVHPEVRRRPVHAALVRQVRCGQPRHDARVQDVRAGHVQVHAPCSGLLSNSLCVKKWIHRLDSILDIAPNTTNGQCWRVFLH